MRKIDSKDFIMGGTKKRIRGQIGGRKINRKTRKGRIQSAIRPENTAKALFGELSEKLKNTDDATLLKLSEILDGTVWQRRKKEKELAEAIRHLTEDINRDEANKLLKNKESRKRLLQRTGIWEKYEYFRSEELFHILFVRKCMDLIHPGEKPNNHDSSKDETYFLVTICHYCLNCPISKLEDFQRKHWEEESHHPEYQNLHPDEITDKHIMETCVNKLARNLQFNHGNYNENTLADSQPNYEGEDAEIRINIYNSKLETIKQDIKKIWMEERAKNFNPKLSDLILEEIKST
jgi:hypothetical protein